MKYPKALEVHGAPVFPSFAQDSSPVTWITAAEAACLLKIQPATVIKRVRAGSLYGKQAEDLPFTADGKENYLVRLESLPRKAQYVYLTAHIPEDSFLSVDLASPRSVFGDVWISQFVNISQLIRDAAFIRRNYHGTGKITEELRKLSAGYGLSLSTLYRFESQQSAKKLSVLYTDPVYLQSRLPKTMCLWCCDLAFALFLDRNRHYSQNDIQSELERKRNRISCSSCPYHPDAQRQGYDSDIPVCAKAGVFMVVPNNRRTLNRLLSHIPSQLILYCRKGYREWRSEYGLFSIRQKPLLVNSCFEGDHHVFDCFVRIPIKTYRNDKVYEKWIAVRPVLTAWMDVATGYIVGWVISVLPNADTIAEAFCRACVPTVGDIASGLPCVIAVDCGKDYKSKLLEDPCAAYSVRNWEESFLNRRFSGLGVLRALNCEIVHSIPYHPQSKRIERFFGTLERKHISKMSTWCHSCVADRPVGFAQKIQNMLESGEMPTMEQFVSCFAGTMLPDYHGSSDDPGTHPDLPGFLLSYESMSPAQRYVSMEKARTVVPDWKTMSIMKRHYFPEKAKVTHRGVRFQNVIYKHDKLADVVGQWVSILCHSFTPPFAPESITVLYQGEALCEAYPAEKNKYTGESSTVIADALDLQSRPAGEMRKAVTRLSRRAHEILPVDMIPPAPSSKDQLREFTYGQTPKNDYPSAADPVLITEAAKSFGKADPSEYDKAYDLLFGTIKGEDA